MKLILTEEQYKLLLKEALGVSNNIKKITKKYSKGN